MDRYIGIDLGGTKVRAGLVASSGRILKEKRILLSDPANDRITLKEIECLIDTFISPTVCSIGIGIPAIPDGIPGRSTTLDSPNLKLIEHVDLRAVLKKKYRRPVLLDNDANCFIIGEHRHGSAKRCRDCVGLTLGTGIGCGILLDGKIRRGASRHCGEIFDMALQDGRRILEDIVSTRFIAGRSGTDNARDAARKARAGNRKALRAWQEYGRMAGWIINMLQRVIDPEAYVLGGSISRSYRLFRKSLKETAGKTAPILVSTSTEESTVIGAALQK